MDILGYRLLQEITNTKQKVNNVIFKDKDWIKSSIIPQIKKKYSFTSLENQEKWLITDIITVDILDPNTIFDFSRTNLDIPFLILKKRKIIWLR
jgi:hypothetical protein